MRVIQFAQDYKDANQKEEQWTADVSLPGLFGGPQRPPSKLKDRMIERRAQEIIFATSKDPEAVKPPPVLYDAKHSVPFAEFPLEKVPWK